MMLRLLRRLSTAAAVSVTLSTVVAPARADVMIRQRNSREPGYEVTLYLKGAMQRGDVKSLSSDGRVMTWAHIYDCARQQFIWLDTTNHRYTIHTGGIPDVASAAFNEQQFPAPVPPSAKGTLTKTTTITDTGERREMFGFTARRMMLVTTFTAAPDACDARESRVETEGWYVDLLHGIDCSPDLSGAMPRWHGFGFGFDTNSCLGRRLRRGYFTRRVNVGDGRLGFPLAETTRVYGERGRAWTETTEVTELSTAPLDDALFSVPAGYVRAESRAVGKPSALSRVLSIFR